MTGQDGNPCEHDLAPAPRSWTICFLGPPMSMNQYRTLHWRTCRQMETEWRSAGHALARQAKIPHLERARIEAMPFGPGNEQDAGNCYPSVKAMIDGLIDAKVLPDDAGEYLEAITLLPGERRAGAKGLRLTIYEVTP